MTRTALHLNLLLFVFAGLFLNPRPTQAIGSTESATLNFADFYKQVQNGEADGLHGVYVSDVLDLPVVQQPVDNPYYVSNHNGEATQF